jgi:hypothetical protein
LKGFYEELELYRAIPSFTCPVPYSCDAMINAEKYKEEDLVLPFLTGLIEWHT